jgi:hypothetical protein
MIYIQFQTFLNATVRQVERDYVNPQGMSDIELLKSTKSDIRHMIKSPWLFWPAELYSFGKIYRLKYGFPKLLPLIFYSDHGVTLVDEFDEHEVVNKARYFLTFSKLKFNKNEFDKRKIIKFVEHPYIYYRKYKNFKIKEKAQGTIIFLPHSNPSLGNKLNTNLDLYISQLELLDQRFKPFTLCIQIHDISIQNLEKLRKYNIPIVSAGNSLHSDFVDKFYEMISSFKFATSSAIGSHTFLCEEFGVKFFIYSNPNESKKEDDDEDLPIYEKLQDVFSFKNLNSTNEKEFYMDLLLGRSAEKIKEWNYPKKEYLIDLVKLFTEIVKVYLITIKVLVRRWFVDKFINNL